MATVKDDECECATWLIHGNCRHVRRRIKPIIFKKKEDDESLSDKEFNFEAKGAYTHQGRYFAKDVKEFIKKLKEATADGHNYIDLGGSIFFKETVIDKLAGKELTK